MRRCEFCQCEFESRPQVKQPRACPNADCQYLRQRTNEREWRERNPAMGGAEYHKIRRDQRSNLIRALVATLKKCLQIGVDLVGVNVGVGEFSVILESFLLDLGVRQINKFWNFKNVGGFSSLDEALNQNFVQTS